MLCESGLMTRSFDEKIKTDFSTIMASQVFPNVALFVAIPQAHFVWTRALSLCFERNAFCVHASRLRAATGAPEPWLRAPRSTGARAAAARNLHAQQQQRSVTGIW